MAMFEAGTAQSGKTYTGWAKKSRHTLALYSTRRPNITSSKTGAGNSFTIAFFSKFAIKRSLNIPPHLKRVATLPCKILKSEN